ncbi:MAG: hypothetical protein AAB300_02720 [Nitrospirota bacterium]
MSQGNANREARPHRFFEGLTLQIPSSSKWTSIAGQKVTVMQLQNGSLEVWYKQQKVLALEQKRVLCLIENDRVKKTQLQDAA